MNVLRWKSVVVVLIFLAPCIQACEVDSLVECVTIAILAKDKAHTLPLYLECLENQTWPASKTNLYIRTNNNNDETAVVLQNWVARVGERYAKIHFDDSDVVENVHEFAQHEWNYTRFKVLGKIRQDSVDWARENNSHYFVADCDNFIGPDTIESMMKTNLPIVAPLLRCKNNWCYANYHDAIDVNGYYASSPWYYDILDQRIKGILEVPVVHCTYFIRYEVLDTVCYDDESARYEYVIFSHSARKKNVAQYLDNRKVYGYITFAETADDFENEPTITF
jgi:hypothetical protein